MGLYLGEDTNLLKWEKYSELSDITLGGSVLIFHRNSSDALSVYEVCVPHDTTKIIVTVDQFHELETTFLSVTCSEQ